jgi:putative alpha-1,2-mannosidase
VEIDREDGSMWVVRAPGVSEDAKYIATARFDDDVVEGGTFTHGQWAGAESLILEMTTEPAP